MLTKHIINSGTLTGIITLIGSSDLKSQFLVSSHHSPLKKWETCVECRLAVAWGTATRDKRNGLQNKCLWEETRPSFYLISKGTNHMISIIPENKLECTFVVQIERKDDTKQCLVRTTEVLQRTWKFFLGFILSIDYWKNVLMFWRLDYYIFLWKRYLTLGLF